MQPINNSVVHSQMKLEVKTYATKNLALNILVNQKIKWDHLQLPFSIVMVFFKVIELQKKVISEIM